ncbi:LOB domain-containing protein 18-like isoform X2 [Hibiscus syriacus]|uniref:LOB domain-containing protein 18-like isoform X2 n=1 Tax=Hibiscus syriacus TaxID=106335 RepID=UPI0019246500|nr:LOB domain-containing protein 18-like isoform X2 [Hibiscus syriacus]
MSSNPSSSGGSVGGGGGGPCGACKFLRRKCVPGCIFAPYFDSEQGAAHFAAVHKVFGASNVSKLLLHIPVHRRLDAVVTICFEAQARLRDPVYGCVAHIFALQQQVVNLQAELSYLQAHLSTLELPSPPPPPPPQTLIAPPPLSISDLPSASSVPATYDLSSLFEPMVTQSTSWAMQQRQIDPRQFGGTGGDLQALARELLHRQGSPQLPCTDASPSASPSPPQSLSK